MTNSFTDIIAWQKAHTFVLQVYQATRSYPAEERFGLCSQFQRAAVSIPANIAEGYKKLGNADKLRFMNIAQGSLEECRYYILLSKDLNYITEERYITLTKSIEEASKLLNAYCKSIVARRFED
ncbi:four helix bundle protein [Bacteroides helcogenes]|uniref:S23 ribosomal protein n=1 Tax=Bacteroides helcogenes (strain ATCC 35417 / DSM 20613 / JCM 6297 / CCUG 15421 / P 36-108) TaxID=693979 RepID=E6SQZ6_BACT6|nr:four helix bundle protein [Bacteroides helcogenes]ADV45065.1 S23 ribosomal protein [Bacteroides helcogenes P 36-108]MDY5239923.1 four helix bundle protein [Bacteroides helcogenes]